jgi:spore coat polysaccharide biosynthesis protein SpsF
MNENIAILLARLDSTRLPNKHFEKIGDKYLIDHCYEGLKKGSDFKIVLATSDRDIDIPLIEWAKSKNIDWFAGNFSDIKIRIADCLKKYPSAFFARVNADSPFIDGKMIDEGFGDLQNSDNDLYTNIFPRSYPYGYSVEIFRSESFLKSMSQNTELENISTFFYKNPQLFKIINKKYSKGDFSNVQLTVDTKEDLDYIRSLQSAHPNLFSLSLDELIQIVK